MLAIVNADDLGISREVNEATFELMSLGSVTSATLLANGAFVHEAAVLARRFPNCSFGAHLNITQFMPLSPLPRRRALVDETGQCSRKIERMPPSPALIQAIFAEFCEQVELLFSLGIAISHLDSHHHAHTRPAVFPALKALQSRYGIRRVRLSQNIYGGVPPVARSLLLKKRVFNWAVRNLFATRTTHGFTDLLSFVEAGRSAALPFRSVELMVHPGSEASAAETALLRQGWRPLVCFPVQLINYRQI